MSAVLVVVVVAVVFSSHAQNVHAAEENSPAVPAGNRTSDLSIISLALYLLSYHDLLVSCAHFVFDLCLYFLFIFVLGLIL